MKTENGKLYLLRDEPEHVDCTAYYPGGLRVDVIYEIARRLRVHGKPNGCKLGIVTSKTRNEYTADFAAPFALSGYFSTVICVEDTARPKPYPDPLLTYLNAARIHAEDALYIGDTLYDCQCAQNAGVDFGLAAWGNAAVQEIPADYIFKRPADVLYSLLGK